MKTTGCWVLVSGLLLTLSTPPSARSQTASPPARSAPSNAVDASALRAAAPQWQTRNRSAHQTEWYSVRSQTNPVTGRVRSVTNSYTELGTGLNRQAADGSWQRASDAFQITATGAEANSAQHRVTLAGNINSAGSVTIEKSGVKMQGHPLCIAYYDQVDGRSELLAELTDATGWLVSSNEIVFSNCFKGIRASIRYRNFRSGLEQDLLLHERPSVTPREIGFSDRTRLELFTEWIGDTPLPQQETRVLQREQDAAVRQQMVEPDFSDTMLSFGALKMIQGKAFNAGENSAPRGAQVGKRFEIIEGRKILIEAVPVQRVAAMLDKLPVARVSGVLTNAAINSRSRRGNEAQTAALKSSPLNAQTNNRSLLTSAATVQKEPTLSTINRQPSPSNLLRPLPAKRLAQTRGDHPIQTALISSRPSSGKGTRSGGGPTAPSSSTLHASTLQPPVPATHQLATDSASSEPAFVLDWVVQLNSPLNNYTFYGTNTYHITGPVDLTGLTTFEGGTVVKYNPWNSYPSLRIHGSVQCDTSDYLPATFTARDDNTIGITLSTSTGTPGAYGYGNESISFDGPAVTLKHLRVKYSAGSSLAFYNSGPGVENHVSHCQFVQSWGLWAQGNSLTLHNVLFDGPPVLVEGADFTVHAEHITARTGWSIVEDFGTSGGVTLVNSILVDFPDSYPSPTLIDTYWNPNDEPALFQTVGAGNFYLANSSIHRNVGTANINASLKTELARRTTHPPQVLTGTTTSDLILAPTGIGDFDALDRGYHYPIIDYAVNLEVDNANVLVTNGCVTAAFGWYGFWLKNSELVSEGQPDALNRFVSYRTVQEGAYVWSANPANMTLFQTYSPGQTPQNAPKLSLRFSSLDPGHRSAFHIYSTGESTPSTFTLRDCHVRGGSIYLEGGFGYPAVFGLINNVFEEVHGVDLVGDHSLQLYNNLFYRCTVNYYRGLPSDWTWRDNLFDLAHLYDYGSDAQPVHDHNAYVNARYQLDGSSTTTPQLPPAGATDKVLTSLAYEEGAFGKFYLPATATQLINQGSRTAAAAGLYHYTTSITPGSKEGTEPPSPYQVDIGLHFVAATALDQPIDTDFDGLSDYFEDLNGDGFVDSTETSFSVADTDGDGITDSEEYAFGLNPLLYTQNARRDYQYDLQDRLRVVTGNGAATLTLDKEGNIQNVTP